MEKRIDCIQLTPTISTTPSQSLLRKGWLLWQCRHHNCTSPSLRSTIITTLTSSQIKSRTVMAKKLSFMNLKCGCYCTVCSKHVFRLNSTGNNWEISDREMSFSIKKQTLRWLIHFLGLKNNQIFKRH